MLIAAMLFAIATDAIQVCRPPDVRAYAGCETAECEELGPFIAEEFATPAAAAVALVNLPPVQASSAQIVTLSRSETPVLLYRASPADLERRHGRPQTVVVKSYTPKAIGSRDEAMMGAYGHFSLDYLQGVDVALVTSNDPRVTVMVVMKVSGPCAAPKSRASRH